MTDVENSPKGQDLIDVYDTPAYREALAAHKHGMIHKGRIIDSVSLCGIHGIEFVPDDRVQYDLCLECVRLEKEIKS